MTPRRFRKHARPKPPLPPSLARPGRPSGDTVEDQVETHAPKIELGDSIAGILRVQAS